MFFLQLCRTQPQDQTGQKQRANSVARLSKSRSDRRAHMNNNTLSHRKTAGSRGWTGILFCKLWGKFTAGCLSHHFTVGLLFSLANLRAPGVFLFSLCLISFSVFVPASSEEYNYIWQLPTNNGRNPVVIKPEWLFNFDLNMLRQPEHCMYAFTEQSERFEERLKEQNKVLLLRPCCHVSFSQPTPGLSPPLPSPLPLLSSPHARLFWNLISGVYERATPLLPK